MYGYETRVALLVVFCFRNHSRLTGQQTGGAIIIRKIETVEGYLVFLIQVGTLQVRTAQDCVCLRLVSYGHKTQTSKYII